MSSFSLFTIRYNRYLTLPLLLLLLPFQPTDEERIHWYLTREWPLHSACSCQESLAVVEYLYNHNPDWVRTSISRSPGGFPVHSLFHLNGVETPPWKQAPDGVHNPKPLENIPINVLEFLLNKYPAPLRQSKSSYTMCHPLLFWLMIVPTPLNIVQLVYKKNPAAIRYRNYYNQEVPLSTVVVNSEIALDVVEFLVQQYPASLGVANSSGSLPLHKACCCMNSSYDCIDSLSIATLPVVRLLRNANLATVNVRNNFGDLPLDGACRKMKSLEFLQLLVDDTKPAARSACGKRLLPLHFAILSSSPLDTIQCLVEIDPAAVTVMNEDGDLALHLACKCCAPLEVIQLLLKKNMAAVDMANNIGFYPLQLACHGNACLDALLLLLKSNPVILCRMMNENYSLLKCFLHEIVTLF